MNTILLLLPLLALNAAVCLIFWSKNVELQAKVVRLETTLRLLEDDYEILQIKYEVSEKEVIKLNRQVNDLKSFQSWKDYNQHGCF